MRIRDLLDPGFGRIKLESGLQNKHSGSATLHFLPVYHQTVEFAMETYHTDTVLNVLDPEHCYHME
jgi:hypothetical protein